jgi:hypothetical protein
MFRPNWVILRQRTYCKEFLLHCFPINTSYLHSRLRLHYVVGVSHSIHVCPVYLYSRHRLNKFSNTYVLLPMIYFVYFLKYWVVRLILVYVSFKCTLVLLIL